MHNAELKTQQEHDQVLPAPTGRVIRRARTGENLKLVACKSDTLKAASLQHNASKIQYGKILCLSFLGIVCGTVLSLLSTGQGLYITKGLDSDKLYKHLENDLIAIIGSDNQSIKKLYHPVKANSTKKSALELTKFITQPANLTSKDPSVAEPVNTGTKDQNKERVTEISVAKTLSSSRSQRLASFYIDPQYKSPLTAIQRDLEHAPHAPTAARVRVVNANYPAKPRKVEFVQHNPKAALSKVYAIIKKHSPKHQAPGQLAHAIVNESIRQGVDPLLVAAVIKSESAFNPRARSHKGAQGLMQIMPATGLWLARQQNIPHGRLTDPGHNLRLGISYLKYLEESFKGDRIFALVAYNWGPGHLDSASGGRRRIPRECMTYALKIINDYKSWHSGVI